MKKLLLLFCFSVLLLRVNAQDVISVNYNGTSIFYTNLDTALADAPAGAVIYLPGSTFSKGGGSYTISKQVSLIGAGHYPDSSSATGKTVIGGEIFISATASNSFFTGMELENTIENSASNLLITRCNFDGSFNCASSTVSQINFQECIIGSFNGYSPTYTTNISFDNCIIESSIASILGSLKVDNCVFLSVNNYIFDDVNNSTITNSILAANNPLFNGGNNNNINNCVFESTDSAYANATTQYSNKFGISASQIFVNQSGTAFSYVQNYHIISGSVALTAGEGGTECGIYGGITPYKEGAVPLNPHIQLAGIGSSTDQSGNLQVNIKVAAQTR